MANLDKAILKPYSAFLLYRWKDFSIHSAKARVESVLTHLQTELASSQLLDFTRFNRHMSASGTFQSAISNGGMR